MLLNINGSGTFNRRFGEGHLHANNQLPTSGSPSTYSRVSSLRHRVRYVNIPKNRVYRSDTSRLDEDLAVFISAFGSLYGDFWVPSLVFNYPNPSLGSQAQVCVVTFFRKVDTIDTHWVAGG